LICTESRAKQRTIIDATERPTMKVLNEKVLATLKLALYKVCWHVSVGGCTLPTFSLAIGEKKRREKELQNSAQPYDFRKYELEVSFFVWCTWRLDYGDSVVTSSNCDPEEITSGLKRLIGKSIQRIELFAPAWDLDLYFDDGSSLSVFCNNAGKKPSFDGNWQAKLQRTRVYAGPGEKLRIRSLESKE
jgi:hypothetical protein